MTIQEKNIEYFKLKSEIVKAGTLKDCFLSTTNSKCSNDIISAHSLQKMGSLAILEREINGNKKIFALTEKQINPITQKIELLPIGKKVASTFFGFCGLHDRNIFEPIEQNTDLLDLNSDQHCFLLSFRAFAISYHRKKESLHLFTTSESELITKIKLYFNTNNIADLIEGAKLSMLDMKPNKDLLINALFKQQYNFLDYFTYEIDHTVPFAMTMLTTPPYLFCGKAINISDNPEYQYSDILTSIIPLQERTLVILAAVSSEPYGSIYLDELEQMAILPMEKALTWHVLTNSENCFFSPELFDKLEESQKDLIIKLNQESADVNQPYLKFNKKTFNLNLFDSKYSI